jgi:uncharacterized protein (DUF2384 family)
MSNVISVSDLKMAILKASKLNDCQFYSTRFSEKHIYSVRCHKDDFTFSEDSVRIYLQSLGIAVYGLSVNNARDLEMMVDLSQFEIKQVPFKIIEEWSTVLLTPILKLIRFVGVEEVNKRKRRFNVRFQIQLSQESDSKLKKFVDTLKSLGLNVAYEETAKNNFLFTVAAPEFIISTT